MMNGRRRPNENLQRSLREPSTGENIRPINGPPAQTSMACSRRIPCISSIGDMKAVTEEYTISMPIIVKDNRSISHFVFFLDK